MKSVFLFLAIFNQQPVLDKIQGLKNDLSEIEEQVKNTVREKVLKE